MSVTHRRLSDIAPYAGEHAIPGIRFRPVRQALGVTAWGMNILELDPHNEGYPAHDHVADGQEEVYLVVEGACTLQLRHRRWADGEYGDERLSLAEGDFVRVPPEVHRKFVTGERGVTLLALGATPGQAYAPPSWG